MSELNVGGKTVVVELSTIKLFLFALISKTAFQNYIKAGVCHTLILIDNC